MSRIESLVNRRVQLIGRTLAALFGVVLLTFLGAVSAENIYHFNDHPTIGYVVIGG